MSFLKRIIKKRDGAPDDGVGNKTVGVTGGAAASSAVQAMSADLQRKFARGVQFNMKIVIRGDRNVGKTALFYRLQGLAFKEEYIPTDEIQVASIQWNYKATDDIVKVEVWDVVDKGRKRKATDGLKLEHEAAAGEEPCLDASFVDVYKGTHAAIFVFDITKQWTYKYVEREVQLVPAHIPIIVLANHRDMGEHRTIDPDTARYFLAGLERGPDAGLACYAEASMRNGFGLKYLHKFFNVPYLKLQRDTLVKQLEQNSAETQATNEELAALEESEEQNYQMFLDLREQRRREAMESADQRKDTPSMAASSATAAAAAVAARSVVQPQQQLQLQGSPGSTRPANGDSPRIAERSPAIVDGARRGGEAAPSAAATSSMQVVPSAGGSAVTAAPAKTGGFMSRLFSKKQPSQEASSADRAAGRGASAIADASSTADAAQQPPARVTHVDDFVPVDDLESALDFLEDSAPSSGKKKPASNSAKSAKPAAAATSVPAKQQQQQQYATRQQPAGVGSDSDDDDDRATNPMVAGFQDELDSSDDERTAPPASAAKQLASAVVDLSSSDDEEGGRYGVVLPRQQQQQTTRPLSSQRTAGNESTGAAIASPGAGWRAAATAQLTSSSDEEPSATVAAPATVATAALAAASGAPGWQPATAVLTAAAASGMASVRRESPPSSSEDSDEDDEAESSGIVVLADEDIADTPSVPLASRGAPAVPAALTITAADLDFLDSITSSPKVAGTDGSHESQKAPKKKKKASAQESSSKENGSGKAHTKKHKARSAAVHDAAAGSSQHSSTATAKEGKKQPKKKASGGSSGAAVSGTASGGDRVTSGTSEADALEAFLLS